MTLTPAGSGGPRRSGSLANANHEPTSHQTADQGLADIARHVTS